MLVSSTAAIEEGQWSKHRKGFYSFCLSLSLFRSLSLSLPSICLSTLDCVPLEIYTGVQLVSWRFVVYIFSVFVQTKVVAE